MKNMNVLMCSSKEFSLAAYVLMQSVMDNNSEYKICFFMSTVDEIDCADSLKKFVESRGHEFNYIHLDESFFLQFKTQNKWTEAVFVKLKLHEYLPDNIDRILYMDMDTICDGSLGELYEIDFKDNFTAACCNGATQKSVDEHNQLEKKNPRMAAEGAYFNSGIILFNLRKIRDEISTEMILEAYEMCLKNAIRYLADQSVLNWLYCEKNLYLNPLDYNYRIALVVNPNNSMELKKEHKRAIIHYVSQNQPYKPWDIQLSADELEQIKEMPFEGPYIYMTKAVSELIDIWWKYAERTPVYDELFRRMLVKKEWFMVYGITTINSLTRFLNSNKQIYRRCGYLEERKNIIQKTQKCESKTFLDSVRSFWGIEVGDSSAPPECLLYKNNIFDYINELPGVEDDLIVSISLYHTAVGNWESFFSKQLLGLAVSKLAHCESYCAIIDVTEKKVIEKSGSGIQKIDYFLNDVPDININTKSDGKTHIELGTKRQSFFITAISQGYDSISNTTISNIFVNNIDYSMSKRGINFVVFNKRTRNVIDVFNVDVHGDDTFKINRKI